ncbi:TRAP transporter small permease [Enterovibrio sp. ZSDZ35]|uniref:TRAP transporter small permease protein n=1 Tax=Enterovibrio qingdaonensis TaxID=2899818 RepID=A0ABT5QHH7_9GAMM|nr:TRAP transporter small permease subunit [Enterovibrio sp. ZSDZ35]MDD1780430.1 TRAP transporter small permease [Enterovibrio sp. ZSDZ35]
MVNNKTGIGQHYWSLFQHGCCYLFPLMKWTSAVALIGMMVLTVLDVLGRYLLGTPILGGSELTGFMLLVLVMLMLPLLVFKDDQIRVDLFTDAIRPAFAKGVERVYSLALSAGCIFLAMSVYKLAARADRKRLVTEYLEIPASWAMYAIAFCLLLSAFAFLFRAICSTATLENHVESMEGERDD